MMPFSLARLQAGDVSAFESLIRQYHGELRAYIMSSGYDISEADDILQDIFLYLWRTRTQLRITHGIRALLYSAVRNRIKNMHRSTRRQTVAYQHYAREAESISAPEPEQLQADRKARMLAAVHQAVHALPERARDVWVLHHHQRLSYAEVAEVLGVTVGTVKSQMARAMGLVRAAVESMALIAIAALR